MADAHPVERAVGRLGDVEVGVAVNIDQPDRGAVRQRPSDHAKLDRAVASQNKRRSAVRHRIGHVAGNRLRRGFDRRQVHCLGPPEVRSPAKACDIAPVLHHPPGSLQGRRQAMAPKRGGRLLLTWRIRAGAARGADQVEHVCHGQASSDPKAANVQQETWFQLASVDSPGRLYMLKPMLNRSALAGRDVAGTR
jgi:hypothetical protein